MFGPNLAQLEQMWAIIGQNLAKLGQIWPDGRRRWPKFDQNRPMLAEFGQIDDVDHMLATVGQLLVEFGIRLAKGCSKFTKPGQLGA